jgi:hypothetical protein
VGVIGVGVVWCGYERDRVGRGLGWDTQVGVVGLYRQKSQCIEFIVCGMDVAV